MFICDYHTHSHFSFDGAPDASVDAICRAAIERGVTDLCITDHFECNACAEGTYPPYDADAAEAAIMQAKETYKDRLHLAYGIELGQANQYPEEAKALLSAHPFEFVIGSIHNLRGAPDFCYMNFESMMRSMSHTYIGYLFERYMDELIEVAEVLPKLSAVGHLTYIQRYCELAGQHYDFKRHFPKAEQLFSKLIARGTALEVNVSTLWKGLGFAMPDRDFLSLYYDCGGRLVTVGTDSHVPTHIGECVSEGFDLLRRLGLNQVLVVRNGCECVIAL